MTPSNMAVTLCDSYSIIQHKYISFFTGRLLAVDLSNKKFLKIDKTGTMFEMNFQTGFIYFYLT